MKAMSRAGFLTAAVCLLLAATSVRAQAPSITSTSPQAVKPGESVDVTINGSNLAGVTSLWTSFRGQAVLSPDVKDNGKNKARCVYRITLPADAAVGVHGIRVATAQGVSPLKLFVVDDLPSVAHSGKNVTLAAAQQLTLPVAVDGTIGSLSRSYFKFKVAAGQRVSFEVIARRMGSPLDPMIRILDAGGRELAYSDDEPGLRSDPQLCYTFKTAGEYAVEVRDISYRGGGSHWYRLRIGDFPCVTVPYPMGAKRGSEVTLSFAGSNIDNLQPVKLKVPADPFLDWINVGARRAGGQSSGFATLSLGAGDEFLETEPNNAADKANRVTLGASLNGRLDKSGDVDRFVFAAKKGQKFTFSGITRRQGSPTYLRLRLLNPKGVQVAVVDNAGVTDGVINYTFPADGDYTLVAEDLNRQGGSRFAYRIAVAPNQPGFTLTASADRLNIPASGTTSVTVTVVRKSFNGPIQVAAVGLPEGVLSNPTVIGPGRTNVILTVSGTGKSAAAHLVPIRVVGTAQVGGQKYEATATVGGALKAANNAMPWPTLVLTKSVVAGTASKAPFSLRVEPAQAVFGRDLKTTIKVIAERQPGYDEAITLAVTPAKGGLPAGITVAVKPIPKGKNEIAIVVSGTNKAALGEFTANLVATHKKGKTTVTQQVPGLSLALRQAFALKLDAGTAKMTAGGQLKVKVSVDRNPAFNAPIALTFQNLPKGLTAAKTSIPAGKSEVEILLTAAQDAQKGAAPKVTVKGDATVGKAKFAATSPAVALTVE